MLNGDLTGVGAPTLLYQPNSADTNQPLTCGGQQNGFCPNQLNQTALNILNLYPAPNSNGGKTYNNYIVNLGNTDNCHPMGSAPSAALNQLCFETRAAGLQISTETLGSGTRDEALFLQNALICRYGQELNKLRRPH